jgi:hypothetical protein
MPPGTATRERAHARLQLRQCERFGEIVVRPEVEGAHTVFHTVLGRENQDRHVAASATQALQHFQPAHLGQSQIQNEQVEFKVGNRAIGGGPGRDAVHGVA